MADGDDAVAADAVEGVDSDAAVTVAEAEIFHAGGVAVVPALGRCWAGGDTVEDVDEEEGDDEDVAGGHENLEGGYEGLLVGEVLVEGCQGEEGGLLADEDRVAIGGHE